MRVIHLGVLFGVLLIFLLAFSQEGKKGDAGWADFFCFSALLMCALAVAAHRLIAILFLSRAGLEPLLDKMLEEKRLNLLVERAQAVQLVRTAVFMLAALVSCLGIYGYRQSGWTGEQLLQSGALLPLGFFALAMLWYFPRTRATKALLKSWLES